MIEITEDKFDDLYDNIESMLGFGSKAMSCLKKMKQERMGERMPDYRDDCCHNGVPIPWEDVL